MSLPPLAAPGAWSDRANWPLDPPGWVFFGRALDELGPALEADWTGNEFAPPATDPTADRDNRNWQAAIAQARAVITGPNGRSSFRPIPAGLAPPKARAIDTASGLRAERVQRAIARACLAGKDEGGLVSGYRYDPSGEIVQIPPTWWNVDVTWWRFASCRIDWTNPSGKAPNGPPQPSWLYLRADTVARFADAQAPEKPTQEVAARKSLLALCAAFYERGEGSVPVGATWREGAEEAFGIGPTAAKRAWARAAEQYPQITHKAGKPKRSRTAP